jgi:hypothetical protein
LAGGPTVRQKFRFDNHSCRQNLLFAKKFGANLFFAKPIVRQSHFSPTHFSPFQTPAKNLITNLSFADPTIRPFQASANIYLAKKLFDSPAISHFLYSYICLVYAFLRAREWPTATWTGKELSTEALRASADLLVVDG